VEAKSKRQKRKCFWEALWSVWNKEEIAALEQRLAWYRNEADSHVVPDLRSARQGQLRAQLDRHRLNGVLGTNYL
jgi:hypothetical protein